MNCPVCGSEIPSGVKYCSVCGTDVEGAQQRARQAAAQAAPTQQMPPQQRMPQAAPQGAVPPQNRAVPMNPSMPPQAATRDFDTSTMGGSPKWPIVVICILVVIIAAIVVLIVFHPWAPSETSDQGSSVDAVQTDGQSAVTPVAPAGDGTGDGAAAVSETDGAASGALTEQQAYDQLSAVYNQFSGFDERIRTLAAFFDGLGSADSAEVQAQLEGARALQAELTAQTDTLNAIQLAEGSSYVDTLANLKTLNNDLVMRTADLTDALQAWADGAGTDQITQFLTRSNAEGSSISVYKTEFDNLYPNAQPVAPQA